MAEIKFTTERMKEVHNRIGEIISQLNGSIESMSNILGTISNNVQSESIKSVVKSYVETASNESVKTKDNLRKLDDYLVDRITAYTATDNAGAESLSEVQNLLNQLSI